MRTEFSRPTCPKAHGYLDRRAVENRIYEDGREELMAVWVCPTCGHHHITPATEIDEAAQVCDFCSQPGVVKAYPCKSFGYIILGLGPALVASQPALSQGEWMACGSCAKLIDADDQAGLTDRSVLVLMSQGDRRDPETLRVVRDALGQMHREFFKHRIKERR